MFIFSLYFIFQSLLNKKQGATNKKQQQGINICFVYPKELREKQNNKFPFFIDKKKIRLVL